MLRLLPSVCRDCGVSSETNELAKYLDFYLCRACIGRREGALRETTQRERRGAAPAEQPATEAPGVQPGKKKKPGSPRGSRKPRTPKG